MNDDQQRLERSLRAWMSDARPPLADREAHIHLILAALDDQPRTKRGFLGRWRHGGSGARRQGQDRTGRSLLNAFTLVALLAVGVVAVNSIQRSATEPATPAGYTFVVAADGSGDFSTISAAVEAADDGATILVRPGTYGGAIDIDRDVTLRGLGSPGEVVIAIDPDVDASSQYGAPYGLRLATSDATIDGLSITGPYDSVGVVVEGGSPTLERLILGLDDGRIVSGDWTAFAFVGRSTPVLRNSQWYGYLAVRDDAAPAIEDNQIVASIASIDGPGSTTLRGNRFIDGAGASISDYARGSIEANEFEGGGGIGIDTQSDVTVVGNTIRGAVNGPAILIQDPGTKASIEGNTIVDSHHGIDIGTGTAGSVVGNVLVGNTIGLQVGPSEVDIADNSIREGRVGIFVGSHAAPTIRGNAIEDVVQQGIFVSARARPAILQNVICGSPRNLVVISGAEPLLNDNEICADEPAP